MAPGGMGTVPESTSRDKESLVRALGGVCTVRSFRGPGVIPSESDDGNDGWGEEVEIGKFEQSGNLRRHGPATRPIYTAN